MCAILRAGTRKRTILMSAGGIASSRARNTMTRQQADELLRKDLRKFCAMFRHLGKDSLLLGTLAYNVGPFRLLGSGKIPKSKLIRKLEAGDRDIYKEYISYCHYKGRKIRSIERRRKMEFLLLFKK